MTEVIRLFGPPGTGKTTQLINIVAAELESGVQPEEIIYTSFTKVAAQEARDRALRQFTGKYHADEFTHFATIHSICFHLLQLDRKHVFTGDLYKDFCKKHGYDITNNNEYSDLDNEIQDMVLQTNASYFEFFLNWYRNMMVDYDTAYRYFKRHIELPEEFNDQAIKLYIKRRNEYKYSLGLFDFPDMLQSVITREITPKGVRVIITDEAQDLTKLLMSVIQTWAKSAERIYIGGDIYQNLYSWSGADAKIMLDIKSDQTIVLKQSFRCSRAVHDISRIMVKRMKLRYENDDYLPTENIGEVVRTSPGLIKWQELVNKRVFYLHRTHYLLNLAYRELISAAVPFITLRGWPSPLQGKSAKVISHLYNLISGHGATVTDIVKVMDLVPSKTQKAEYVKIGAKVALKDLSKTRPDSMVFMSDLHSLGFLDDFIHTLQSKDPLEPLRMDTSEKVYMNRMVKKYGQQVFIKPPEIILSTLHGVKGMEADVVIINQNLTRKTYAAFEHDQDPEHRLFYVGCTRAKEKVILLTPEDSKCYWI